jgi:peptide/nickel transport system permease protein
VADAVRDLRHAGFVDAALSRGESDATILRREIRPALAGLTGAEIGARFVVALRLAAALSLLGLGPTPPAPDWAAMIRENVSGVGLSPAALVAPAVALAALNLTMAAAGSAAARQSHPARSTELTAGTSRREAGVAVHPVPGRLSPTGHRPPR